MLFSACVEREDDIAPVCEDACTTISGYLTTGDGTGPLPNANLTVYWKDTPYLSRGTVRRKAIATSDANGYYELNFHIRPEELENGYFQVEIPVNPDEYLICGQGDHSFAFHDLQRDTAVQINYFIPRKAFVEIQVYNQEQIQEGDYFATNVKSRLGVEGKQGCGGVSTWSRSELSNAVLDVAAEQPVVVRVIKTRDGIKTESNDTLTLAAGEKVLFEAEF